MLKRTKRRQGRVGGVQNSRLLFLKALLTFETFGHVKTLVCRGREGEWGFLFGTSGRERRHNQHRQLRAEAR